MKRDRGTSCPFQLYHFNQLLTTSLDLMVIDSVSVYVIMTQAYGKFNRKQPDPFHILWKQMKPMIFQLNLSMPYQQISKSIQIINHDNQLE